MSVTEWGVLVSTPASMHSAHVYKRNREVLTSAEVGAGILVGAVLLTLSTPFLRRSVCDEECGSSQSGSSVRKHVVMLHNSTI
jgi:hypothetical protein